MEQPRSFTAVPLEPSEVYELTRHALNRMYEECLSLLALRVCEIANDSVDIWGIQASSTTRRYVFLLRLAPVFYCQLPSVAKCRLYPIYASSLFIE